MFIEQTSFDFPITLLFTVIIYSVKLVVQIFNKDDFGTNKKKGGTKVDFHDEASVH